MYQAKNTLGTANVKEQTAKRILFGVAEYMADYKSAISFCSAILKYVCLCKTLAAYFPPPFIDLINASI